MDPTTRTAKPAPAQHAADSHDVIRVQGARVNNLVAARATITGQHLAAYVGP